MTGKRFFSLLCIVSGVANAQCVDIYHQKSTIEAPFPVFSGESKVFIVRVLLDAKADQIRESVFKDAGGSSSESILEGLYQDDFRKARNVITESIHLDGVSWLDNGSGEDALVRVTGGDAFCELIRNQQVLRIWPNEASKIPGPLKFIKK